MKERNESAGLASAGRPRGRRGVASVPVRAGTSDGAVFAAADALALGPMQRGSEARRRLAVPKARSSGAAVPLMGEALLTALAGVAKDRTVAAIAHRLETVEKADRVVVLDDGRIVDDGPPAVVLTRYRGELAHAD